MELKDLNLTVKDIDDFLEYRNKSFKESLDKALKSGAIPLEIAKDKPYLVLRAVYLINADNCDNWHKKDFDKFMKNLKCFI